MGIQCWLLHLARTQRTKPLYPRNDHSPLMRGILKGRKEQGLEASPGIGLARYQRRNWPHRTGCWVKAPCSPRDAASSADDHCTLPEKHLVKVRAASHQGDNLGTGPGPKASLQHRCAATSEVSPSE